MASGLRRSDGDRPLPVFKRWSRSRPEGATAGPAAQDAEEGTESPASSGQWDAAKDLADNADAAPASPGQRGWSSSSPAPSPQQPGGRVWVVTSRRAPAVAPGLRAVPRTGRTWVAAPLRTQDQEPRRILRDPGLRVESGRMLSLPTVSYLTEAQLAGALGALLASAAFRWYAGRCIFDVKAAGVRRLELREPWAALNPVVEAMTAIARRSLRSSEELAVVQLLVNRYKDGGDEAKPHIHRCRQICLSLGAERELKVGREVHTMRSGDIMLLDGEVHSVPAARGLTKPRVSICLFYCSAEEFASRFVSVNAFEGRHGKSIWWQHPDDIRQVTALEGSGAGLRAS